MNNLTTRKIVLGMLMALVLAFSVQGTADALTFSTSRTGDLQTVREDREFRIRFSVSLRSASIKSGYKRTPAGEVDTGVATTTYYEDTGDSGYQAETQVVYAEAHNYDQESISIAVPSGPTLQKINGRDPVASTPYSMYERTHDSYATASDSQKLSGSVELTLMAGSPESVDITITGTTDDPSGPVTTTTTFTVYIVAASLTVNADTLNLTGGLSNGSTSADDMDDPQINTNLTLSGGSVNTHVPMTYKVTGSGRVYVRVGERRISATATLPTSSAAPVYLDMNGSTNRIEVSTPSVSLAVPNVYIYGRPTMTVTHGADQEGILSGRLNDYLAVQVKDEKNRPISGLAIAFASAATNAKFTPVAGFLYGPNMMTAKPTTGPQPTGLDVYTDRNGEAKVYYQLGSADDQRVTATLTSRFTLMATFNPTIGSGARRPTLSIVSGNNQRTDENGEIEDTLVVVVKRDGHRLPAHNVVFVARKGVVTEATKGVVTGATSSKRVTVMTDGNGEAEVMYDQDPGSGSDTVTASITSDGITSAPIAYEKEVTFTINGAPSSRGGGGDPDPPPVITRGSLNIATSGSGNTRTVTVTASRAGTVAPGISVLLNVNNGATLTRRSGGTPLTSTLTLPATAGTYTLTATTTADYTGDSETITVTLPGTLLLALVGTENNGAHTLQVIVQNSVGTRVTTPVTVTLSGAGISRTVSVTGSGNVPIALPTTSGTLFARATGYNSGSITLPARTTTPTTGTIGTTTTTTTTTTTDDPPEPSRINIVGSATRSENTANQQLDQPLLVQVLDDDDDGVEDARVIFRVKTGQGRLSQRGNGRAIAVQTDARGHARATYTPMSASSTVEAEAKGVTRKATFTITTGAAPATDTTGTTGSYKAGDKIPGTLSRTFSGKITINGQTYTCTSSGECVISNGFVTKGQIEVSDTTTPGTSGTPRATEINPVVHVGAASRPPMLWVDGGAIYALVGANVQRFAPGVDNALNIAVGGGKVYWTEKTGESGGTINSANLNGSGVTELASIFATPMGIAVDVTNNKLYWTNSAGRIQSANLDGSRITSVIPGGLEGAMDIALAGGNAYWTQGGNVRFVNLRGTKQIRNVSTGTDAAGSLVIGGGKVYWTEKTAASAGTINSANLNGTGVRELTSIRSVPMGIAVDTARSKLYWTASSGKVKQANLNGSGAKNVVSGLGSPSDMVLSNSIAAPAATPTTRTTTTASRSKYDVNGDGTVDNADAALVADAMGTSNTKYDVNGDGTVNFLDLLLVFDNRDAGAAGAPTIVGMKLSAAQIDIIEEQIDLLIATNDRSPSAMRVLVYLQQLLVTARPEKTQLLANYPNPFNPETWIPYELATDTDVRLTIYNTQGVVIRTMPLGHQSAGYYTGRDRAAYWDGRNALGEQVASGLYFYQLETDEMSSMRKMVILK